MADDKFNMSMRKFLKQVGVTSQQEIERVVREKSLSGKARLKVKMVLTAEATNLTHVVEGEIDLSYPAPPWRAGQSLPRQTRKSGNSEHCPKSP